MFIAAFEKNIECLENRFNQNGLEYYEALQQVLIIDIENYFKEMEPSSRKLLSEVGKILDLVLVLPATNATSERNFSKMGLIKNFFAVPE